MLLKHIIMHDQHIIYMKIQKNLDLTEITFPVGDNNRISIVNTKLIYYLEHIIEIKRNYT